MKTRLGFISNSSSTTFICDICGTGEGGFDLCISDIEWAACVNDCYMCDQCKPQESSQYDAYEMPADICPICTYKHIYTNIFKLNQSGFLIFVRNRHEEI